MSLRGISKLVSSDFFEVMIFLDAFSKTTLFFGYVLILNPSRMVEIIANHISKICMNLCFSWNLSRSTETSSLGHYLPKIAFLTLFFVLSFYEILHPVIYLCKLYMFSWQWLQLKSLAITHWDQQLEIFILQVKSVEEVMELSTRWESWSSVFFFPFIYGYNL